MNNQREIIASFIGYYLDGWADLIEKMGEQTENVENMVYTQLTNRDMPEITINRARIREGFFALLRRNYIITSTSPGARTTIYISMHGKDLYVSWRSFIKTTFNWRLLLVYAIISLSFGLLTAIGNALFRSYKFIQIIFNSQYWDLFTSTFGRWVLYGIILSICGIVILLVLGRFISGDEKSYLSSNNISYLIAIALFLSLFIEGVGQAMSQDLKNLYEQYQMSVLNFTSPLKIMVINALSICILVLVGAIIAGLILRRNLLAFILKEPSLFNAEDITAMNLSVHKSMLRALDLAGIEMKDLRVKSEFKGGRRGEII